jgi:hypothetical protein
LNDYFTIGVFIASFVLCYIIHETNNNEFLDFKKRLPFVTAFLLFSVLLWPVIVLLFVYVLFCYIRKRIAMYAVESLKVTTKEKLFIYIEKEFDNNDLADKIYSQKIKRLLNNDDTYMKFIAKMNDRQTTPATLRQNLIDIAGELDEKK